MVPYAEALALQKQVAEDISRGVCGHTLLVCQHPAVITYSRKGGRRHILVSPEEIARRGIALCETDRGGDVTYHGPGQTVFYPVFDLREFGQDLHRYMRMLEEVVIVPLREHFGLNAIRRKGLRGVWVGPYKIAFIGIAVRKWVAYHGLSLNISVDREAFSLIKPCGLDVQVGSINDFFKDEVSSETICDMILEHLKEVFQFEVVQNQDICEKGLKW
ncbi:MAG: lipoyl(octanoyl) transferase LipB [Candidatus Omnitrophica bacterium]|nr:lipoyl(octanoyl) transferase LipB [Candidatus Omnitrophota bacterium]MDD5574321.1 lipoyl(octanoyl) transferase LipB [Candidatus Omnitrophota bacterium]